MKKIKRINPGLLALWAAALLCLSCSTDPKVAAVNNSSVLVSFTINQTAVILAPGGTYTYTCTDDFVFSSPDQGSVMPRSVTYRNVGLYCFEFINATATPVHISSNLQSDTVILKEKEGYLKNPDSTGGIKIAPGNNDGKGWDTAVYTLTPSFGVYSTDEKFPDLIVGTADYKIDAAGIIQVVIH